MHMMEDLCRRPWSWHDFRTSPRDFIGKIPDLTQREIQGLAYGNKGIVYSLSALPFWGEVPQRLGRKIDSIAIATEADTDVDVDSLDIDTESDIDFDTDTDIENDFANEDLDVDEGKNTRAAEAENRIHQSVEWFRSSFKCKDEIFSSIHNSDEEQ